MKKNMFYIGVLGLLALTSCEASVTNNYSFAVKSLSGDNVNIGEEIVLTAEVEANFEYKVNSVTINGEDINDVTIQNHEVVINTGVVMNTESKKFTLTKFTYTNLEENKQYVYTTALEKTIFANASDTPEGGISLTEWGLSQSTYLLKDWEINRDSFYVWFKIEATGQASVSLQDSFVVNGQTYSVLYDETEQLYLLKDIKYDINPTKYETITINLESINYTIGDETKTLAVKDNKQLSFTQGVINANGSQVNDANMFDSYNKRIEQVDDVITFGLRIYNPTDNELLKGKITTNLGEVEINKNQITLTSNNGYYFNYEIKINVSDLSGTVGNSPVELSVSSVTLIYSDSSGDNTTIDVLFPLSYKVDVYTKFVTDQNGLLDLDGKTGSYILINDISLNLNSYDFENSVIMNLNGYLNGNKKTIKRTDDCFNALINTINTNGKVTDLIYYTYFRANNYVSNYAEGTAENKRTDGYYDSNKDYSKTSAFVGINNGTIQKVRLNGSIYVTDTSLAGKPLSYDGIVGLNYGTMKDIEIAFENMNLANQSSNFDFKELTFVTYKNYGTVDGVLIKGLSGQFILAINQNIVKNINIYFITKENYGTLKNLVFMETFVSRIQDGNLLDYSTPFNPFIDQFFFFPVKEGSNSKIENYYYSENVDTDRETYFGNIYNGRPVYKYFEDNNETIEGQTYLTFKDKYGEDVLEKTPGFSDELFEDGIRTKKFYTKYLINDYVYGATDKDGNLLFRNDITRLSFFEINGDLFKTVFSPRQYKDTSIWKVDMADNNYVCTVSLNF